MSRKRILFVDDEPLVLEGLQRLLRPLRADWDMEFLDSGFKALERIARAPFDVVVSDSRMPGIDGARFLGQVRELAADSIRIMLTGQADVPTAIQAVNQAGVFRFLLKPLRADELVPALEAGLRQRELMQSERRLLELQLEHAQKMSLVGQCSASLVHEFKNMLTVIAGFTDLALGGATHSVEVGEALRHVRMAAENGRVLTGQMLTFTRQGKAARFQPLDLSDWLRRTAVLLGPLLGRRHVLECACLPGLKPVAGDPAMLTQVLLNLTLNACDAMPESGTLRLGVEPADAAPVSGRDTRGFVRLSVRDSGCGMDEATRQRLFQPFFTTKPEGRGTGLGLAVTWRIVERHGGWIEVASQVGAGTTFNIYLPCHGEEAGNPGGEAT